MKTLLKTFFQLFLAFIGFGLLYTCKMYYIAGSLCSFFSLAHIYMPMAGMFGSLGIALVLMLKASYSYAFLTLSPFFVVYHFPTISASAYFISRKTEWLCGFIIPALCIALFTAHPVGQHAYAYSFYWFIPMIITFFKMHSLFARSLASTFIAHAVGSVIWLHTHPTMTSSRWMSLIPVVAYERCMFAIMMTVGYMLVSKTYTNIISLHNAYTMKTLKDSF